MNLTINPQIKVSVIVPVYNREKYLKQCVDSIVAQTLREIEIILVDDGSTDDSPVICDEYAAEDPRVKVIHKQNAGMGAAYNTGMAAAKGEYIGFVESDDWIEPEMYEELYAKATEEDVDVVKSLYTSIRKGQSRIVCKFNLLDCNKRFTSPLLTPQLCYGHISHWSAIYRRTFIEQESIQFPTSPGAAAQDIGFNWHVFVKIRSYFILSKSFYNYREDNPVQSMNRGMNTAMAVLNAHRNVYEWNIRHNIPREFSEISGKAMGLLIPFNFESRCRGLEKLKFLFKASQYLRDYASIIKFERFDTKQLTNFHQIAFHPLLYCIKRILFKRVNTENVKSQKILGIKLYEKKRTEQYNKRKLLYLPIRKEIFDKQGSKIFYLGLPLVRITKKGNVVKKRFLGIHYKTNRGSAKPIPFANDVRLLQIITHANAITNTHQKTFTKYKNCHAGQDIALVATGPTLNYFEPIKNCVYVGVNKVVLYDKVHFDYLFFQDFVHLQAHEILGLIGQYKKAKKFYGIPQDTTRQDWIVPESAAIRDQAERYYVIPQWKYPPVHFTYDIANEPFGDCGSVSFAAMQFILWTNPRRIYLIGQDNTTTYFDRSVCTMGPFTTSNQLRGWKEMVKFAKIYYPDTEIVSINPVGLKGMFKDKYTKSYLKEHPEIEVGEDDIIDED